MEETSTNTNYLMVWFIFRYTQMQKDEWHVKIATRVSPEFALTLAARFNDLIKNALAMIHLGD